MNLILWLIFGAITGWVASLLMRTNTSQGMLMDIVVGILGASIGGLIFNFFGVPGVTGFNLYSALVSVVGAIALIMIARLVQQAA